MMGPHARVWYSEDIMASPASAGQMENNPEVSPMSGAARIRPLYTVGHSNHDWHTFLALLRRAGVTLVADVRSSPYSRRLPHFNRAELELGLRRAGLGYVFLGDLLGGRPKDPDLYGPDGRVDYEKMRWTFAFQHGLERLVQELECYTLAMLCAEDDPLDCHRGLMIAPALRDLGIAPLHLRKGGLVESTPEMESRLLAETGVGAGEIDGLFASQLSADEKQKMLAEAYRRRASKKAYQVRREEGE
jgi:hypothetical protein